MESNFTNISKCNLCENFLDFKNVLSLGKTPLANSFVKEPTQQEEYPLDLLECQNCGHVQLSCIVNPDILFKNYLYVSGTSKVFVDHFRNYAQTIMQKIHFSNTDMVVDIGSNDGTFLSMFMDHGIKIMGVEPATNIADQAINLGIPTIKKFFNKETANQIYKQYGFMRMVSCNNTFAHSSELKEMLEGVKTILHKNGLFVFEVSYLPDLLEGMSFDNIYHEHISFHHLSPLVNFFEYHGMRIYDVERIKTHGGSIRVFAAKHGSQLLGHMNKEMIKSLIKQENDMGLFIPKNIISIHSLEENNLTPFVDFENKIKELKDKLVPRLKELKEQGKTIIAYGAPAKQNTFLHYLDIGSDMIDYIVDDSPLKQGLFSPGKNIPIFPSAKIQETNPDVILLSAWNFADSIIKNNKLLLDKGVMFINPLPEYKEITKENYKEHKKPSFDINNDFLGKLSFGLPTIAGIRRGNI